jgi:hypothetical protein
MKRKIKDSKNIIIIGRDANGAEIKIDNSKLTTVIDDILKDALEDKIKELGKPEKFRYGKLLAWIIIGTVAFFALAVILNKHFDFGISDDSIVVAFIGIIATFVVISNYMQLRDVKTESLNKIVEIEDKFKYKTKEIENTLQSKIESTKDFLINQARTDIDTLHKNDNIKFLEYDIELHYNTLQALICYDSQKYIASLYYCMIGLSYLNKIKAIEKYKYYQFEDVVYYIKRLEDKDVIRLTENEKAGYIKILEENKRKSCTDLINFIKNIQNTDCSLIFGEI